jgi:hypothetical protein
MVEWYTAETCAWACKREGEKKRESEKKRRSSKRRKG